MPDQQQAIVVIGISAGGMPPLLDLVRSLPPDCSASFFVVQHIPPHAESSLALILDRECPLRVVNATHNLSIAPGTIYTAKSDHHLLVEEGRMLVTRGPKENHWRPAIDSLFRSAAYAYRRRTIGVILSGTLNDGTSGLWSIKHFGGVAIIQSRAEALFDGMPQSAAEHVEIDHEVTSKKLGELIGKISKEMSPKDDQGSKITDREAFTKFEIGVARGKNALAGGVLEYGTFSPLTCPDCHGALTEYSEGKLKRYRCHTGHAHTAKSLLAGIDANIETNLWEVMRGMEEGQLLLNHLADALEKEGQIDSATNFRNKADLFSQRSQVFKSAILTDQTALPQPIEQQLP